MMMTMMTMMMTKITMMMIRSTHLVWRLPSIVKPFLVCPAEE